MSTKNKLTDLNNHLFAAIERLNDEEMTDPEKVRMEIEKAKAMSAIARNIVDNNRVAVEVMRIADSQGIKINNFKEYMLIEPDKKS